MRIFEELATVRPQAALVPANDGSLKALLTENGLGTTGVGW
jgi:hypothetical protein